jgi:16S rRNA (guanine(527)-N(7))-methyltransferase RsmG
MMSAYRGPVPEILIETVLSGMDIDCRSSAGEKISRFLALLVRWNRRVNLISSTRPDVLTPLIREAVWAAGRYPSDFRVHLDIGSGAGFPAIPLAAIRPDVKMTMVESREKKAAFLQTAVHDLQLANVRVANERLGETLRRSPAPSPWDCVSWKAVKLSSRDFKRLLEIASADVRLWMFHGNDLPVENPALVAESLELVRRDACPFHPGWFLSDFRRQAVSRETG